MRIVLSQAVNRCDHREVMLDPLGLGYLSSYVRAHMPDVEFYYREGVEEILSHDPDLVGVSTVSQNYVIANELARELREHGYTGPLLLGGVHISELPTSLIQEFDAGVIGEGEQTFLEIIKKVREEGAAWRDYRESIPGICFRSNGELIMTQACTHVRPLDQIPPPDRDMLSEMWPPVRGGELRLFTSRGCPFNCGFCSSSHMWKTARYFSAEYVLREMSDLVERYRPGRLLIHDDNFVANRKRLKAISEGIRVSGLADEVEFVCSLRADYVDKEMCEMLKGMNTCWVTIGVESASNHVLGLMNKRTTVEQNLQALHLLKQQGIEVEVCFILGYPGETVEDMKKTVAFVEDNLGTLFRDYNIFPIVPFPGTRVWEEALKGGLIKEDFDPVSINRSTNNFNPDRYIYLNPSAPRETFLRYFLYLRFVTVREKLWRSSQYLCEASDFQAKLMGQIDAVSGEMQKASKHITKVEAELSRAKEHIAKLENNNHREKKNFLKRIVKCTRSR